MNTMTIRYSRDALVECIRGGLARPGLSPHQRLELYRLDDLLRRRGLTLAEAQRAEGIARAAGRNAALVKH